MLATPLTAWPAMCVKSGPTAAIAGEAGIGTAAGAGVDDSDGRGPAAVVLSSSASDSLLMCRRAVSSRPPMKPAARSTRAAESLRSMDGLVLMIRSEGYTDTNDADLRT